MDNDSVSCSGTLCHPPRRRGLWQSYRQVFLSRDFVVTAATLMLIIFSALAEWLGLGAPMLGPALALTAVTVGGLFIVVGAVKGLLARELNVDELVSVALVASVIVGEYLSAAFVAFMMLAGKILEDFTAQRASNALEDLANLKPKTARMRRDGVEVEVAIEALVPGDLVLVRSGEAIPVDGEVVSGQASVNQAPITGESMPVPKHKGSEVFAGTMNELGMLEIRTVKVGDDTTLGRIAALVAEAEANRAPIVRIADRYARYFSPAILVLAVLVFLITRNPLSAVTVLIVACPCALVMATPTAIVAGVANAARRGILIKGGARLEAAGEVDAVAIDKTGTLSLGEPQVQEVVSLNGWDEEALLEMATASEKFSEHPLGRAIVRKGEEAGIRAADPNAFEVIPGRGVLAEIGGRRIVLGSADLLSERGIILDRPARETVLGLQSRGKTSLLMAADGEIVGAFGLADRVRPEAAQAIAALRRAGVRRIVMLTGDNPAVAAAATTQVGIDEYAAELLPEQKVAWVRKLQAEG
ncbi:MAG: heavy metal translocating P-type ATPase, partial [Chloroflexota bacterium]